MSPYWNTDAHDSPSRPTNQQTGTPRLSAKTLLFAQMRGIIEHIGMYAIEVKDWKTWNGVDAMEVFYGYAEECRYQSIRDAFNEFGDEAYQDFISYWNDCMESR